MKHALLKCFQLHVENIYSFFASGALGLEVMVNDLI